MNQPDMFANKLCALLDRSTLANRDIFDCWFFMQKHTPVNKAIVETRMNATLPDYLQQCIDLPGCKNRQRLIKWFGRINY